MWIKIKHFVKMRLRALLALLIQPLLKEIAWSVATHADQQKAYEAFAAQGMYLLREHYYLPIPDEQDKEYAKRSSDLIGLDMNEAAAFDLLDTVLSKYKTEINAFPVHDNEGNLARFHLINGGFMAIDSNVYYALIRHYQPRRIVEIGSGYSTLLAAAAIRKNVAEGRSSSELICIEPYPRVMLQQDIPEMTQLLEKRVQDVAMPLFETLEANDILFIDSTHVLRPGGDVWWEYCEILPRLKPGVFVHVHDVSLPKPYPRVYLDYHWYWQEQYLLQAFLAFNPRFEVIWPGNYLMTHHPERMQQAFTPEYQHMRDKFPTSEPSSLWMRVAEH